MTRTRRILATAAVAAAALAGASAPAVAGDNHTPVAPQGVPEHAAGPVAAGPVAAGPVASASDQG